ncbi:MAG: hypothetical protein U9R04_02395 [Chloroflexota bacterium]|nr:hypothetical protein [Chloroflexota bacterium]
MTPVISNDSKWNEEWHEKLLTISLLEKGPLQRKELKKRIRSIQKANSASFEPHLSNQYHSYSNYNHWICNLIERGVIEEDDRGLTLTSLGKWVASSKLGSLFERDSFLQSFICKKCATHPNIVLLAPLLDTIDATRLNTKGHIWLNLRCPRCGTVTLQKHLTSKDELVSFYNQAVAELGKFVKLEASKI